MAAFFSALKRKAVSLQPPLVIGIGYLVLGTWGVLRVETNPFFLLFFIPGGLLLLAGEAENKVNIPCTRFCLAQGMLSNHAGATVVEPNKI